jgi:hypothetical protein
MNAKTIINDLDLPKDERMILARLADLFESKMPDTLYMDPYELAPHTPKERPEPGQEQFTGFSGTTPAQWEQFLDIPEIYRYRHGKISKLAEFAAIKAMKALEKAGQGANAGAVSALKEIASLSKQLNSGSNNKQKVILTYVKPKARQKEEAK